MYSFGIAYCQGIVVFACAAKHKVASQLWEVILAHRVVTSSFCLDSKEVYRADHDLTLSLHGFNNKATRERAKKANIWRE